MAHPLQARSSTPFSGLGTAPVDIELFHAANVTGAAGGATFVNNGTSATQGTVAANITVVNGTPQAATQVNGVTPVAGAVTFTVNSTTSEADYPVVFTQPATGNALAVNASGAPTAAFGGRWRGNLQCCCSAERDVHGRGY